MTEPEHAGRRISVLVVDDQSLVRDGISRIVRAQPDMSAVGSASDGAQAVDRVRELRPDVVLMDVRMPGLDGVEATRRITAEQADSAPRVLGLTSYDNDAYAIGMLRAGAVGFILKDSTAVQLADAIRAAWDGTFTAAMSTTQRLLRHLTENPEAPGDAGRPGAPGASSDTRALEALDTLTARERDILARVVAGRSNPEIARELYVAEVTVKTHVGHVLMKLGVRDRVQLVIWAYRHGLADSLTTPSTDQGSLPAPSGGPGASRDAGNGSLTSPGSDVPGQSG
ncbi:response regulator transcription factor [Actinomyces sp. 2119]|uniref:response regulator n=1 Tax=Actinomyces sp. 2119 TaxID=2321393 RepID=UPI00217577AD|nr:response regulator transcription factor [Actinomyces sp. 2119]